MIRPQRILEVLGVGQDILGKIIFAAKQRDLASFSVCLSYCPNLGGYEDWPTAIAHGEATYSVEKSLGPGYRNLDQENRGPNDVGTNYVCLAHAKRSTFTAPHQEPPRRGEFILPGSCYLRNEQGELFSISGSGGDSAQDAELIYLGYRHLEDHFCASQD